MKKPKLTDKNHDKRFGVMCSQCGNKLGKVFTEGMINRRSVRFCSFNCQDNYVDKSEKRNKDE